MTEPRTSREKPRCGLKHLKKLAEELRFMDKVTRKLPRIKEQAVEVGSDGTMRRIRRKRVKTVIRDKAGEYCCDNGNFGKKHKCQKRKPR